MKTVRIRITGRVQGVGYRAASQRKAEALGIHGWVRNLPDGRVEAFAQGKAESVDAFVDWCHQGPTAAKVQHVDASPAERDETLVSFGIRRDQD